MSCENYSTFSPIRLTAPIRPRFLNRIIRNLPAIREAGGIPAFQAINESNLIDFSPLFIPEEGWRVFLESDEQIQIRSTYRGRAVSTFHGHQGDHFLMAVWQPESTIQRNIRPPANEALIVLLSDELIRQTYRSE